MFVTVRLELSSASVCPAGQTDTVRVVVTVHPFGEHGAGAYTPAVQIVQAFCTQKDGKPYDFYCPGSRNRKLLLLFFLSRQPADRKTGLLLLMNVQAACRAKNRTPFTFRRPGRNRKTTSFTFYRPGSLTRKTGLLLLLIVLAACKQKGGNHFIFHRPGNLNKKTELFLLVIVQAAGRQKDCTSSTFYFSGSLQTVTRDSFYCLSSRSLELMPVF